MGESEGAPVESALEQLLLRVVPGLATAWRGASASEIERLQAIAGQPLPALYRWFLERMGASMGPMRYPTLDFSASGILSVYGSGRIQPHPRFLLIGYEHEEDAPLHYFYDLERPARGDALVLRMLTPQDERHEQLEQFETLREMLAWGELWAHRVEHAAQQCRGALHAPGGDLQGRLAALLGPLGFHAPVETGAFCGLYERADVVLLCSGPPDGEPNTQPFSLGGADTGRLALVLSSIAGDGSIEVTPSAWLPPLPTNA